MKKYLDQHIPKINEEIERFIQNLENREGYNVDVLKSILYNPIKEFIANGGKKVRPILTCLSHDIVEGNCEDIYKISVIPELIHTGTLVIDDIEDRSKERRGKQTLHLLYGEDIAINLGNFLYFAPLNLMKEIKSDSKKKEEMYEAIADEMTKIHMGQGTDIYWTKKREPVSEQEYLEMCSGKTGALFRMAARLGTIAGNGKYSEMEVLKDIFESAAITFQIRDDILNLKPSERWGKEHGEDLREGKMTLMASHILKNADKTDRKAFEEVFGNQRSNIKSIWSATHLIEKYDAFNYANDVAERLIQNSRTRIKELKDNEGRVVLSELLELMIGRDI